jgi:polyvinyl alcohol dehydrogenase (cytochrome)
MLSFFFFLLSAAVWTTPLWAQADPPSGAAKPSGQSVYARNCASCHSQVNTRAPLPDVLKKMSTAAIVRSMEGGVMMREAARLSKDEKVAVAEWLTGKPFEGDWKDKDGWCEGSAPAFNFDPRQPHWVGWGPDSGNTRFQPAEMARMTAADLPKLKLKWAFGFEGDRLSFAQPAIAGGRLFAGSAKGTVYSLNPKTGCIYWSFQASDLVRTAISLAKLKNGRWAVFFGDGRANAYALDAETGKLLWMTLVNPEPYCRVTGAPAYYDGTLYVPTSCIEDIPAMNPQYECCKSRGSVGAVDTNSGKLLWNTFMTEEPKPTTKSSVGTQLWGPSGVSVWASLTVDPKRKVVYAGTGNNHSNPPTPTSDAVIALDFKTGKMVWVRQLTPGGDAWNMACGGAGGPNCPENKGPDYDVGSTPVLRTVGGKDLVVVGQKSGMLTALDPDNGGKIVWQTRAAKGGALGGIEWGVGADEEKVYVPVADPGRGSGGGIHGIRLKDGEKIWFTPPQPCPDGKPCVQAQMAAPTVIPGVVFSGSMDGVLRAYDTKDGKILWEYNTIRDYETVNRVAARGGSLNGSGPVVVDGMLYVNSGYGMWGGRPGNVLLAFGIE